MHEEEMTDYTSLRITVATKERLNKTRHELYADSFDDAISALIDNYEREETCFDMLVNRELNEQVEARREELMAEHMKGVEDKLEAKREELIEAAKEKGIDDDRIDDQVNEELNEYENEWTNAAEEEVEAELHGEIPGMRSDIVKELEAELN